MRRMLFFAVALIALQATARADEAADKIAAAKEAVLQKIPEAQRKYAQDIVKAGVPRLTVNPAKPIDFKEGTWGELFRSETVIRSNKTETIAGFRDFDVRQVFNDGSVLIFDGLLLVEGLDTKNIATNQSLDLKGKIFEVKDTKAIGASKVRRLVLLDIEKARKGADELLDLERFRVWHDASGKYSFAAKFIQFKKSNVELIGLDQKPLSVPLSRLSKVDVQYVQKTVKERAPPAKR